MQPLCPLWGPEQLSINRPGIPCPWPLEATGDPRPCAVSHQIGTADARTTRRFELDPAGRVIATSDHDASGEVLAGRVYQYEDTGDRVQQHVYRNTCGAPVATYLHSRALVRGQSPPSLALTAPGLTGKAEASIEGGLFSDRLWLQVQSGDTAAALAVDGRGQIIARRPGDRSDPLDSDVERSGGRLVSETIPTRYAGRTASVSYRYNDAGHIAEIVTRTDAAKGVITQSFVFAYECQAAPSCEPAEQTAAITDPFAFDPGLEGFAPRTCSEQLQHSPRICDPVAKVGPGVSVHCCQTAPDDVLLQLTSPMLGGAAGTLQLESSDGRRIDSKPCQITPGGSRPTWRCAIPRASITTMAAESTPVVALSPERQGLLRTRIDLARLQAAAR